jgi:hypothetical protein
MVLADDAVEEHLGFGPESLAKIVIEVRKLLDCAPFDVEIA